MDALKNLWYNILTVFFGIFSQVMVKGQPIWDKFKIPISIGLGLILGLIIGWGIFPVEWENATPGHLRADFRGYYLDYVAQEYAMTQDIEMVREKLGLNFEQTKNIPWLEKEQTLPNDLQAAIEDAERFDLNPPTLQRLQADLSAIRETPVEGEEETEEGAGLSLLTILGALFLVLVAVGAVFYLLKSRAERKKVEGKKPAPSSLADEYGEEYGPPLTEVEGAPPLKREKGREPLKSFTTTYVLGDDYFDPSFSIEIDNDFLGECGIGISETIGDPDPKKVTAFEAWLFDKSDIKTITKVLASDFAINEPDLYSKLEPKGEDVLLLKPGMEVVLETTALRVQARIRELEYAEGNLPNKSYVQKLSVELRAWIKQEE
ncbi:MAG: hypothetical protein ACLFTI_05110 [Anaerolineales bacterium]